MGNKCLHSPVLNRLNYPFARGRIRTGVAGPGIEVTLCLTTPFFIRSNRRTGIFVRTRTSYSKAALTSAFQLGAK